MSKTISIIIIAIIVIGVGVLAVYSWQSLKNLGNYQTLVTNQPVNQTPSGSQPANNETAPTETYTNQDYGFAFDYPRGYYLNVANFHYPPSGSDGYSGDIDLTSDLASGDLQGGLPDSSADVMINLRIYSAGSQSLDEFIGTSIMTLADPYIKTDISAFQAVNVSGKQYYWHPSTEPNVGPTYPYRVVAFKAAGKIFLFEISGNIATREAIVKSFRTI